ncbi:hypothetical protein D3C71_1706370 [compost metagenome]
MFRLLVLVDQPGDHLDQPRVVDLAHRANTKLLDQHHFVAQGIVRQHAHRIVTHEQLATDLTAHATGEQLVAQVHPVELVKALEAVGPLDDLDRPGHGIQRV